MQRRPLLNRPRATDVLSRGGLGALVLTEPLNVYYATGKLPVLDRMTSTHQSVAVIPANPDLPVAYVGPGFEYYYNVADSDLDAGIDVQLVAPAAADPLKTRDGAMLRILDRVPLETRELHRRSRTAAARFHDSIAAGLDHVLRDAGLAKATIGFDSFFGHRWLAEAAPGASIRFAEDVIRHIRLVKTKAELALLTAAAEANVSAMRDAIRRVREAPTLRGLREIFFSEAARRGNTPIFMLIDGVMDETYDEPLREGKAFLVDAVSHRAFYQGDYARTACLGEPSAELKRVTRALSLAWDAIRERLRPGLRFSQIREIGLNALAGGGYDYTVAFKPHSVGLAHEDQPRTDLDGKPLDVALEPGMVLSVDCPLLDVGVGGSAHLEDLTLITESASRPIHTLDEALILA